MIPRVLHLVDGPAPLRAVLDLVTGADSVVIDRGQRPPRARRPHVVHAHEGTHSAGRRLATRFGVPLVISAAPSGPPPEVDADLVLAPDAATADRLQEAGVPGAFLRQAPGSRIGVAADLDSWYRSLAQGDPLSTDVATDPSPSVTVVMSTFQRADLLARSLGALAGQTYPADRTTLVVVDNGSTDDTPAVLQAAQHAFGARLTTLRNAQNASAAAARNRALTRAVGDIIAFTDDDCRPTPAWLETLVGAFRDDVGIVQGRTRPDPAQQLRPTSRSQWTWREQGLYETCNIAYRRSVLEQLGTGPFATDLPDRMVQLLGARIGGMAFGEDVDLAWRARRLGLHTRFAADAIVHHHVFDSDVGYLMRRSLQLAGFPMLVRDIPELRDQCLYARWFLTRRHLLVLVAAAGAVSGSAIVGAAASAPYVTELLRPWRPGRRRRLAAAPLRVARDVVESGALAYGSVRARTMVL